MIVSSTRHRVANKEKFLEAAAKVRARLLDVKGCRNVTLFESDGACRLAIEWRGQEDLEAFDASDVAGAVAHDLAEFPADPRVVEAIVHMPVTTTLEGRALRTLFGHYPTGVAVITSPGPLAMVVTSFASVSLDPPLVSFCAARTSSTWPHIADTKRCCVNILASDHGEMSRLLATRKENRFEGFSWKPAPSGAPILDGVVAWLDCAIVETRIAGDHDLVLLEVQTHGATTDLEPLLFHRSGYRSFGA